MRPESDDPVMTPASLPTKITAIIEETSEGGAQLVARTVRAGITMPRLNPIKILKTIRATEFPIPTAKGTNNVKTDADNMAKPKVCFPPYFSAINAPGS